MTAAPIPQIGRDELWKAIQGCTPLVVVDALAPMSFAHSHLPGAINLIPERVDDEARRRIPDLDADVVVYCANPECESSVKVAEGLVALGYRRVRHYPGGRQEGVDAGVPVEGRARAARCRPPTTSTPSGVMTALRCPRAAAAAAVQLRRDIRRAAEADQSCFAAARTSLLRARIPS